MLHVVMVGGSADVVATLKVVLGVRWRNAHVTHLADMQSALRSLTDERPHMVVVCPTDGVAPWLDFIVAAKDVTKAALVILADDLEYLDRVKAFESGADDCLPASCVSIELLARINAILRRTMQVDQKARVRGPLRVDPVTRSVTVSGTEVTVSPKEFSLLSKLAERPNIAVSHNELLCAAWGPAFQDETELLRKTIFRLRSKL